MSRLLLPGLCIPKTRTPLVVSGRRLPISDSSGTSLWRPLSRTWLALKFHRWPACCCPEVELVPQWTFFSARLDSTTNGTVRNSTNTSPRTDKPSIKSISPFKNIHKTINNNNNTSSKHSYVYHIRITIYVCLV